MPGSILSTLAFVIHLMDLSRRRQVERQEQGVVAHPHVICDRFSAGRLTVSRLGFSSKSTPYQLRSAGRGAAHRRQRRQIDAREAAIAVDRKVAGDDGQRRQVDGVDVGGLADDEIAIELRPRVDSEAYKPTSRR